MGEHACEQDCKRLRSIPTHRLRLMPPTCSRACLQDAPPEAEPFKVETINVEAGRVELAQLGIPVM